jgi:hypothetical protein
MIAGPLMVAAARNLENIASKHRQGSSGEQAAEFIMVLDGFGDEAKPAQDEDGDEHNGEPVPAQAGAEKLPDAVFAVINLRIPEQRDAAKPVEPEAPTIGVPAIPRMVAARLEEPVIHHPLVLSEGTVPLTEIAAENEGTATLPVKGTTNDEVKRSSIQVFADTPEEDMENPAPSPSPMRRDGKAPEREVKLAPQTIKTAEVTAYPSPAVQIMSQITAAMPPGQVQATAASPLQQAQFADPALASPSDVKALRIKLQPEELGEVEVTIRRAGLQTKVTITVAGKATAEALSMDKGFLEERLGSLFTPGTANTVMVSMEIRETGPAPDQSPQTGGGQGWSETAAGGRGFGRDGRPDHREHTLGMTGDEHETEDRSMRMAAGMGRVV